MKNVVQTQGKEQGRPPPFTTHEAPLVIRSDEKEDQDKTSPTSPPDHKRGHPAVHEYQPKSLVYPPLSDSSDDEDFSSMPDLVTPEEGMSPVTDHSNDSGYETHEALLQLMSMPTRTTSRTRTDRRYPGSSPRKGTAQSPLAEATSLRDPLMT